MVSDYKQKYLKYKIKYLNAKKKFRGGADRLASGELEVLAKMESAECPPPLNVVYNMLKVLETENGGEGNPIDEANKTKLNSIIEPLIKYLETLAKNPTNPNGFIKQLGEARDLIDKLMQDEAAGAARNAINTWASKIIVGEEFESLDMNNNILEFIKKTIDREFKKTQTTTVINELDKNTLHIQTGREQKTFKMEDSNGA
jgi:hypothetical protein